MNKSINACFRKIRIKEKEPSELDKLMNEKREIIRNKLKSEDDMVKLDNLNKAITNQCEDKEFEKLQKVLGEIETVSGSTNVTNVWKEMKKAFPKKSKPLPSGVLNIIGKIITNPEEKKKVVLNHFEHRMRKRPVVEYVKEILDLFDKKVINHTNFINFHNFFNPKL